MSETLPKEVIERRVRNRIIEYLELVSSQESQQEYQAKVPYIQVSNELFNQWEDWVPWENPQGYYSEPVFTISEQKAIINFHETWNLVANRLPQTVLPLKDFIQTAEWKELQNAAMKALSVFYVRGKLPED